MDPPNATQRHGRVPTRHRHSGDGCYLYYSSGSSWSRSKLTVSWLCASSNHPRCRDAGLSVLLASLAKGQRQELHQPHPVLPDRLPFLRNSMILETVSAAFPARLSDRSLRTRRHAITPKPRPWRGARSPDFATCLAAKPASFTISWLRRNSAEAIAFAHWRKAGAGSFRAVHQLVPMTLPDRGSQPRTPVTSSSPWPV